MQCPFKYVCFVRWASFRVFDENVGNTTIFVDAVQPLVLQATEVFLLLSPFGCLCCCCPATYSLFP